MAKQVTKNKPLKPIRKKSSIKVKRNHPKYGTSKLEIDFAHDFLDALGIKYIYQFYAESIGRYYDFAIVRNNGKEYVMETKNDITSISQDKNRYINITVFLEIDGSYHHSDPRLVDENKMSPMQKKNKKVDMIKNEWAAMNNVPLIRIWEYDIRKNPKMVKEMLKNYLYLSTEKTMLIEEKNKRHTNSLLKKKKNIIKKTENE